MTFSRRDFLGTATGTVLGTAAGTVLAGVSGATVPADAFAQAATTGGTAATQDQETVLTNGRIYTMDARNTVARAASIRNGRFVAVTTGTQGGSPVQKPRTMLQEVHRSETGQAVYVFALPKKR